MGLCPESGYLVSTQGWGAYDLYEVMVAASEATATKVGG